MAVPPFIDARSVTIIPSRDGKYVIRVEEWFGNEYTVRAAKVKIKFYIEVYDYSDGGLDLIKEIIADDILLEKEE